ncbi:MAG: DUF134 domain-containing protein [Patescibacteria group bacterium]|nr:DUF134 domain-containing protein [Patescibacteria group bacterium]
MTRPRKFRRVCFRPRVVYFKPRGVPMRALEEIEISREELEALRLKYVKNFEQIECARQMEISQSTFQRLLSRANKKIAQALIRGRAIKIVSSNNLGNNLYA